MPAGAVLPPSAWLLYCPDLHSMSDESTFVMLSQFTWTVAKQLSHICMLCPICARCMHREGNTNQKGYHICIVERSHVAKHAALQLLAPPHVAFLYSLLQNEHDHDRLICAHLSKQQQASSNKQAAATKPNKAEIHLTTCAYTSTSTAAHAHAQDKKRRRDT